MRNEARILDAASQLLGHTPEASLGDIAAAAGVSRSTLYRRFPSRAELLAALERREEEPGAELRDDAMPAGRPRRERAGGFAAVPPFAALSPPRPPGPPGAQGGGGARGPGGAPRAAHPRPPPP